MPTAQDSLASWLSEALMSIAGFQVWEKCVLLNKPDFLQLTLLQGPRVLCPLVWRQHLQNTSAASRALTNLHLISKAKHLLLEASWQHLMLWPPESTQQKLPQNHGITRKMWLENWCLDCRDRMTAVPHGTACAVPLPSDGKVTTTCLLVQNCSSCGNHCFQLYHRKIKKTMISRKGKQVKKVTVFSTKQLHTVA